MLAAVPQEPPLSLRVLVVDDDPDYRLMLRLQLELQHGVEVVGEAGDGIEALAWLAGHEADIVVLDLMMPRMDGYETIVHAVDQFPGVPIVAYSAVGSTEAQAHCDAHGVRLMRKSGDTAPLYDTLVELTRERGGRPA